MPAAGKWESLFGDVVLDWRAATVSEQEMRIDAGPVFGDIEVLVPEGIVVEVHTGRPSAPYARTPARLRTPRRRESF